MNGFGIVRISNTGGKRYHCVDMIIKIVLCVFYSRIQFAALDGGIHRGNKIGEQGNDVRGAIGGEADVVFVVMHLVVIIDIHISGAPDLKAVGFNVGDIAVLR